MCCPPLQGHKRGIRRRLKLMFTNSVVHETKRFHRDPSLSPAGRESTVLVPCSQNEKYDGKDDNDNEVHYRIPATNITGVDVVSEVQHESGINQSSHYGGLAKVVQAHDLGVVQLGQLTVQHEDDSEATSSPGDVYECKPGHQAQVVGDEPCVMIEFDNQTAATYARH